jgi:hypothetical protein
MRQLSNRSQNSLDTYLLDFYVKSGREAICRYQGVATFDEEMEYVIRQHSYGCLGTTIEWILGKNGLSVESMPGTSTSACPRYSSAHGWPMTAA